MSVNSLTFEQSSAFLMDMYKEATGQESTVQVVDTATFTSVATTLLQMGYDPIINSITQVLNKSIYSIRPYSQKFRSINVDEEKWGSIVRKINYIDSDLDETDDRLALVDGESIDPYVVKKPKVVQTNFYGATQYADHITIFRDQLDRFGELATTKRLIQNGIDKKEELQLILNADDPLVASFERISYISLFPFRYSTQ